MTLFLFHDILFFELFFFQHAQHHFYISKDICCSQFVLKMDFDIIGLCLEAIFICKSSIDLKPECNKNQFILYANSITEHIENS